MTSNKAGPVIPKFSLDDVEETQAELAAKEESVKPTRGRRGAAKKVTEELPSPAPRARRGKQVADKTETEAESPVKSRRGRKVASTPAPAEETTEAGSSVKPRRGRKAAAAATPVPAEETAAKRGVRGKKAVETVETTETTETMDKAVMAEEPIEEEVLKSTRGRKTSKKTETPVEEPVPSVKKTTR